jgi:hypothetical protein
VAALGTPVETVSNRKDNRDPGTPDSPAGVVLETVQVLLLASTLETNVLSASFLARPPH